MMILLFGALSAAGYEVSDFEDAESALSSLNSVPEDEEPEVLMTDIRMPGMSGLELAKQLRDKYTDTPVIVMTAHTDLDSALASYESGAFEYLPKPFDLDEAVRLVSRGRKRAILPQMKSCKAKWVLLVRRPQCRRCFERLAGWLNQILM